MTTPIYDFITNYKSSTPLRLHMPGHKGVGLFGFEEMDITEIDGADVLYSASGIIRESMENASSLFGSAKTLYSTEGASLCIRAMMSLLCMYAKKVGRKATVLAGRNSHKVFVMAAGLLDIDVEWLYSEKECNGLASCSITPLSLENKLLSMPEKPLCVYITSPDYLGNISDIKALSDVCKKYGILLFADNAHGAYLKFLDGKNHPIDLGADLCCDSAHKTLSALTGAAYLHISKSAPEFFKKNAETAMSMFASTSPSYLILQSLDLQNKILSESYRERLSETARKVEELKSKLTNLGFRLGGSEPLKITLFTKSYGYKGEEFAEILTKNGIYPEFYDPDFVVFMVSTESDKVFDERLLSVLSKIEKRPEILEKIPSVPVLRRCKTIKEALFSNSEKIPVKESLGRCLAVPTVSCPPAVPIAVCGEIIDEKVIKVFEYYGKEWVEVVKE